MDSSFLSSTFSPQYPFFGRIKYSSALSTDSCAGLIHIVRIMSMNASCFSGVFRCGSVSPKNIYFGLYWFNMFWIDARSVVTYMVKFIRVLVFPFWNDIMFPPINQPMRLVSLSPPIYSAVPIAESSSPVPALGFWVYSYFGENAFFFFLCKHSLIVLRKLAYVNRLCGRTPIWRN